MEDNYNLFRRKDAQEQRWLAKRPVCCYCGHPIQDENLYDIEGNLYHEECLNDSFRKHTEDYIA